ncbi:3-deoxy-D-manno-octulosonic acid transferase [hydrothermal vent metagenome]|uniref:3-deoxy-D-manno-octulosonic acid transferase n=1 Tax=hydrothermal vent metagenome TaxID=652676 RepID=A0A3B0RJA3_9ZZZZ
MARSLSLAAYMTYARRATKAPPTPETPRPAGDLIWAHASDTERAEVLVHLAQRLQQQRPGVHFLLTTNAGISPEVPAHGPVIWQELPEDTIVAAKAFLHHWQPDICLWTGADLFPALLITASQMNVPLLLIDVDETQLAKPGWRWFPDLPKALLGRFRLIMVHNVETAMHLHRIGVEDVEIHVTGPLQEGAMALPYEGAEREKLAAILLGRPVWLAAMIALNELECVLDAHRQVSKFAHRSLLIIVPDNAAEIDRFQALLKHQGWRYALRSGDEAPGETTQVLLANSRAELGLWYVLSPVSYLGNSMRPGQNGHDPNAPAAHGSAIIHGPNVGRYLERYSHYAKAGATRLVRDTHTLTAAVQDLIAPDQSATMAQAAWDVVSRGAVVTDMIIEIIEDRLDTFEASP